jgi:hypothetical protein
MSKKRFLIDSANVVHYFIDCPLKVGSYKYEGEFDIVVIEKDEIAYGNKGELEPRRSKLCPGCTGNFIQRLIRRLTMGEKHGNKSV